MLPYLKRRTSRDIREQASLMAPGGGVMVHREGVVPGVDPMVRQEDVQEAAINDLDTQVTVVGTLETM